MERGLRYSQTNRFEQSELELPRDRLIKAGATVDVVSLTGGEITGWDKKDWGRPVKVDKTLGEVAAADYGRSTRRPDQSGPATRRAEGAEIHQGHLRCEESPGGRLSHALGKRPSSSALIQPWRWASGALKVARLSCPFVLRFTASSSLATITSTPVCWNIA
jgi:hypothetical protein